MSANSFKPPAHSRPLCCLRGGALYWSFIEKGRSAHQCIDRLCFQSDGPLVNEFERLFGSLFEDPKPYVDLIRIIASQRYGIGQAKLITKSKLSDGGNTVRRLHQLEEAGFIVSFIPYGRKDKGVYYLVDDEYSLFYLYWIEPNLKGISKKSTNQGFWVSQSSRPAWKSWSGLSFESVCYKHVDQIRQALKINAGAIASSWRFISKKSDEEGVQIDLLFDRPDGAITICEIKCSDTPFKIEREHAQQFLKKIEIFRRQTKTEKQLFLAMITTMGLKPSMYAEEIVTNYVTLKDLFRKYCKEYTPKTSRFD